MSIAGEIQRLQEAKTDIRAAIQAKGVSVPASEKLDNYDAYIGQISGGGGESKVVKDVNFFDYDGTLLHSYTEAEFLALSSMPENPSHEGLTAQGWNWSFEEAVEYVQKYGMLVVGQQYTTSDGKTRVYITLPYSLPLTLRFSQTSSQGVVIDWGDGSNTETVAGTRDKTLSHSYESSGDFVITMECQAGTMTLGYTNQRLLSMPQIITKAEIGDNVTSIGTTQMGAFTNAYELESINIPQGVYATAFATCQNLKGLVYPKGSTYLNLQNLCANLISARCVSLPPTITGTIGQTAFTYLANCPMLTLPEGVAALNANVFNNSPISRISIPDTVVSMGNRAIANLYNIKEKLKLNITTVPYGLCQGDYLLEEVQLADTVTIINQNAFSSCRSLKKISDLSNVTTINANAFYYCEALVIDELNLPALNSLAGAFQGVPIRKIVSLGTITTIPNSCFLGNPYLTEAVLPATLTSIVNFAFQNNTNLVKLTCLATTPPTIANLNAFTGCPLTEGIFVPAESVEAYKTATNWSNFASKIQAIPE